MSTKGFTNDDFYNPGNVTCSNSASFTTTSSSIAPLRLNRSSSTGQYLSNKINGTEYVGFSGGSGATLNLASGMSFNLYNPSDTKNWFSITSAGVLSWGRALDVIAYNNTQVDNVTGDSTVYTTVYDVEVVDVIGSFASNTTFTFTGPTSAGVLVSGTAYFGTLAGVTAYAIQLVTSNRTYTTNRMLPTSLTNSSGSIAMNYGFVVDMDNNDTCTIGFVCSGVGALTVDWLADATNRVPRVSYVMGA